ncbi:ABC transporter substrate-binding protein [Pseudorhodoplanes sp.]|uniref:ABC transporter substrate-binding protein n=1 Tax=Pseudorhodoplanes sp. TaxID=1934341 RepID=UPI002B6C932D|nr:ABC transporter substrate-binding protein [Pseudorhodoplanes sp.]HWV52363.1 ABC transporter substrate-binding protein [Pseudorhodoplanes sp.]
MRHLEVFAAASLLVLSFGAAKAENGVTRDQIVFGQSAVLQGPASALGLGMQEGLLAAFDEVNRKGGVHGRKLKLTSIDDGYEPSRSLVATRKLIEDVGPEGAGVIVSQVVPFRWEASLKVSADYRAAIKARNPKAEPEFVSLEGYLVGRLAAALERAGAEPTRAGFLKVIKESGAFDLGGLQMTTAPTTTKGSTRFS